MEALTNIQLNPEGYLTNADQWNPEVARLLAEEEEITLTEDHWKVLDYLREQHKNEVALTIRRVGKSGVVTIKEFYQLFPKGPLKISSRLAGIPKPASCI